MSGKTGRGPELVFVLKDGIRGHENQSAGVAWWLRRLSGAEIVGIDVPGLSGFERFFRLKVLAKGLKGGDGKSCRRWLESAGGDAILGSVLERIADTGARPETVLFLSAGSSAAPWCLALSRVAGVGCCTIMTPSILGTSPFDLAIVPEHDFSEPASDILVTLGAPNMIRPELLESEAALLASRFPSGSAEKWGMMIGGEDANYTIRPDWVSGVLVPLVELAAKQGADVYITTSRRTQQETEDRIAETAGRSSNVRMLVLGSKDPWNPVPGMLGFCDRIFCTEDSVSMISEAATAGHVVFVLGVDRKKGLRKTFMGFTNNLVEGGFLPPRFLWGSPRFDLMIDSFCRRNLAAIWCGSENECSAGSSGGDSGNPSFNEAKRAAEWILARWTC